MVIANYPQGFIGQTQANVIREEVKPIETIKEEKNDIIDSYNIKIDRLRDKERSAQDKIDRLKKKISSGESTEQDRIQYSRYVNRREDIQREIRDLKAERDKVRQEALGGRSVATIQPKTPQPQQQTVRDVIITESGFQSKAYSLQTEEEKKAYSSLSSKLTTTSEGVKYGTEQKPKSSKEVGSEYYLNNSSTDSRTISTRSDSRFTGIVKPTSEVFGERTLGTKISKQIEIFNIKAIQEPNKALGYNVLAFGLGIAKTGYEVGTKPYTLVTGPIQTGYQFITNPYGTGYEIGERLRTDTFGFLGEQTGFVLIGKGVGKVAEVGKQTYIKTGSTYVPEREVFSSQVLVEGKKFPTTTSTEASLQRFNIPTPEGKIIVSTASPSKLIGTEVARGPRAQAGLEDPILFVTAKGEGSPKFTGIVKSTETQFTLNPIKPIQEFFRTPGVTEFEVLGVKKLPREVVKQPGFEAVKTFAEEGGAQSGYAFISKRSELGQKELTPQYYSSKVDFTLPKEKVRVIRDGKSFKTSEIKKGDILLERGTTESEAGLLVGTKFEYNPISDTIGKIKGYKKYTTYEGKAIPIREGKVIVGEVGKVNDIKGIKEVSLAYEEYSSAISSTKFVSPVSSLKSVSVYSPYYSISTPSSASSSVSSSSSFSSVPGLSSVPSIPSKVSSPSVTSTPSGFSTPSIPSYPSIPSTPSTPSYPSTPSIPSYPSTPSTPKPPSVPIIPILELPSFSGVGESKKKKKESKLYVRKKGKFELKGVSEDVGLLFKKGKDIVESTASASFKVVSDSGQAILPNILPSKFYESKKEKGVAIQKRQFRIGSFGEKQEITYKGLKAQRDRRLI